MATHAPWSRRATLSGLLGGLCAPTVGATQPPVAEAPPVDRGALLETAFDKAQRLTVPVYLNARGPYQFVVDTGANRSVVSQEVAAAIGLPTAGFAAVHGIVSAEPAPMVKVDRLRVGEVLSSGLRLPSAPASRLGADGILGLDAMRGRRVRLGFLDGTFSIDAAGVGPELARGHDTRIPEAGAPVTVPARYRSGQLVILDAEAAGRQITAFLDSGSQVTVGNHALRDLVFSAQPQLTMQVILSQLISATGQQAPAEFAPLPGLRLGGVRIDAPLVAFADLHIFNLWDLQSRPTVLIGVDVMRRFNSVGFDFVGKTVTFWPLRYAR
jgi:hypothetical protein